MTQSFDLEGYLLSKGLKVRRSNLQLNVPCMFCNEDPTDRGRLYLNDEDDEHRGLYQCFLCDETGNLRTLRRHFGDPPLDDEKSIRSDRSLGIFAAANDFYVNQLTDEAMSYLVTVRGFTEATIERFRFGWANRGSTLAAHLKERGYGWEEMFATGLCKPTDNNKVLDFLGGCITFPYTSNGSVVQIRGKEIGAKYLTPPGQTARLFNTDAVWGVNEVIVAEGEFDAIALSQLGFNAVGVPGAAHWADNWDTYFADVNRVFVMYDPDEVGQKNSLKPMTALAPKTKNVVLPVPEATPAKEVDPGWLLVNQGWRYDEFRNILDDAIWANSLLVSPRDAHTEWSELQGVEGFKLGFETFDNLIRPGLLAGQVMVPLAKTNSGKTLLLLNIFQRAAMAQPDAKMLFLSLEQTRGDWFERARRIWNFYNLDCDPDKVNQSTIDFWEPRLRLVDKNRVSPEQLHIVLDEYEEQVGQLPDLVAVDYLGYWASGFKAKDRYTQVGDAIMEMKGIAKDRRIRMIAPHQVNRSADFGQEFEIDQARDSGAIEETADFVMSLWNSDSLKDSSDESRTGTLNMVLGKSRHGGKGQKIQMKFGYMTLVVVPMEDARHSKMASNEVTWHYDTGLDWTDAIRSHATGTPPKVVRHLPGMPQQEERPPDLPDDHLDPPAFRGKW